MLLALAVTVTDYGALACTDVHGKRKGVGEGNEKVGACAHERTPPRVYVNEIGGEIAKEESRVLIVSHGGGATANRLAGLSSIPARVASRE